MAGCIGMDDEPQGITSHFTDDAWRDAYALVTAVLHDDDEGQDVVLAEAELRGIASVLAAMTVGALGASVKGAVAPSDFERLTEDQLADLAKMALINGLRAIGAPEPPMPPSVAEDDQG